MSQGGPASNGAAADARSGITRLTIDIPDSQRSTAKPSSQGSRWSTTEFRFYALCFALVVPCLVWVPIGLSSRDHPNFSVYAHKLSQGWIPGRLVDMSDPQYRQFRNNLISLLGMGGAHLVASSAFCRIAPRANKLHFTLVFSVGLLVVLHGINAVKVVAIIAGNWWVARTALNRLGGASWTVLAAIWIYNTALLFANDWFGGYPFGSMHASLGWLVSPPMRHRGLVVADGSLSPGRVYRTAAAMAHQFQHHHASLDFLWSRLAFRLQGSNELGSGTSRQPSRSRQDGTPARGLHLAQLDRLRPLPAALYRWTDHDL